MNIEKQLLIKKGDMYCIELDKLAIPETVKVTLNGKPIIPHSFDYYGHPWFTEEQGELGYFKEEEIRRQRRDKYFLLEAEIVYEERLFDVQRSTFDTTRGISQSLKSISDLNEMLRNREMFLYAHNEEILNEFILFGRYFLSATGVVEEIQKIGKKELIVTSDIEEAKEFIKKNEGKFILPMSKRVVFPKVEFPCPCCGKVTIEDVKNGNLMYAGGKFYHRDCWIEYRKLKELDTLTRGLMDCFYDIKDYHFEILTNKEWSHHVPWLFHTIDGDIKIVCRKRGEFEIEWQENYKPFDMKELFATENTTKWEDKGKRGIHAVEKRKAFEYLLEVLNTVNPGYHKGV